MAETGAQRRARYARKVSKVINGVARLERQGVREGFTILKDVRKRIVRDLRTARGFDQSSLRELLQSVDNAVREFEERYRAFLRVQTQTAWQRGHDAVRDPLKAAVPELSLMLPGVDPNLLIALQGTTADLVTAVGNQMRAAINDQVRLTVTGVQRPDQSLRNVTKLLSTSQQRVAGFQRRPTIAAQAEAITRTETNRVFGVANFEAMKSAKNLAIPDAKKRWITNRDGRERPSHRALNNQIRPMNHRFTNGLMFPLDPSGPPQEVINCRCRLVVVRTGKAWEKVPA